MSDKDMPVTVGFVGVCVTSSYMLCHKDMQVTVGFVGVGVGLVHVGVG